MASLATHQCQRQTWSAYFASEDVVKQFEDIVDSLVTEVEISASTAPSDATAPKITAELLAQITHQLQIAQERVLGKSRENQVPGSAKLPASLFSVPSDSVKELGPLYNMLSATLEYAVLNGVDLGSTQWATGPTAGHILTQVRQKLADNRQLPAVRVHLASDIAADDAARLGKTVSDLGGRIVSSEQEATHIVESVKVRGNEAGGAVSGDDVWFRTLKKHNEMVLVHWWYTPDSYDAWVTAAPPYAAEPEDAPDHTGPWRVSVQWIEDSVKYNEWLNEEDYESSASADNADAASGEASSSVGTKRRAHVSLAGDEKRLRVDGENGEMPEGVEAQDLEEAALAAGNRKRNNEFEPLVNGELANVPAEGVVDESKSKEADNEASESNKEAAVNGEAAKEGEADKESDSMD
ncbi:SWI/SNF and RSC complex subunit Ssr2, partial [Linderina pennispora]